MSPSTLQSPISLPRHIAIIPDGNRRWAKNHHLPQATGHAKGAEIVSTISQHAWKLGIEIVSVWALSTENFKRSPHELSAIMQLCVSAIADNLNEAIQHEARIIHIGRTDRLSLPLRKALADAQEKTKHGTKHYWVVGLDYGGQDEIVRAAHKLAVYMTQHPDASPTTLEPFLDTHLLPYPSPDVIIRTGGEHRLSGFMSWQSAYSELMFVDTLLPDFTTEQFDECLKEYASRQRRFGA